MKKILLATAIMGLLVTRAQADDLSPPPYRGDPLSVEAHWDFTQNVNFLGEPPDVFNTVGGSGGETLYTGFSTHIDFTGGWNWDGVSTINTVGPNSAMGINTQNWVDELPLKLLRIQVTYSVLAPIINGITAQELAGTGGEFNVNGGLLRHVDVDANNFYEDWQIVPNPDWEQIVISADNSFIHQIDVDTVSIPEPSTFALAIFGLLGLGYSRRKRS